MVERALAKVTKKLPDDSARRLHAVVHLLASADGFLHMNEFWGLSAGDATQAAVWAIETLAACDLVACEDTRRTRVLLNHFGIKTPGTHPPEQTILWIGRDRCLG